MNYHHKQNSEILAALNIREEYQALGLEITGSQPSSKGWLECRAIGREDNNPSAAIHIGTGYYVDLGGEGEPCSLWDFAVKHGPHAGWREARKHYATKAGVTLGRGRPKKDPRTELIERPWNEILLQIWCRTKPGVTLEALRANGGMLAGYPAKSQAHQVVAMPIFGPRLVEGPPCGWMVWHSGGRPLPKYDKQGKPRGTAKMKMVAGSQSGLMGQHGLARLAVDSGEKLIWKTEGPTDMLALWALIPPDKRNEHLVVCNSAGTIEDVRPEIAVVFTGHRVRLVHDADEPGEVGIAKWMKALQPVAKEVRQVQLPFEIVKDHGKDLRDWINECTV